MSQFGNLFSCFLPLVVDWHSEITLGGVVHYVTKHIKDLEKHNTYLTDISARHPALEGNTFGSGIVINLTGKLADIPPTSSAILYFQFDITNGEVLVYHRIDPTYQGGELSEVLSNLTTHVATILDKIMDNSHVLVNAFCFLTPSERYKLLTHWGRGIDWPIPVESISELFERQVAQRPDSQAIFIGERVVSYHQLWVLSEKVAAVIRRINLPEQSLIGIYINRGVEMLAIIFGILKANCVYVPIDTKYPLLKIEAIIYKADLAHVITSDLLIDNLTTHFTGKQEITFHAIEKILVEQDKMPQEALKQNQGDASGLAYIMFTSGTTGAPKGVMVTQRNILNYCQWFSETTHFNTSSTIDFSSSIAFDLSIPCTIAPLLVGGRIAICEDVNKTNPQSYLQHLITQKVTHTELTPGYVEMLLNYPHLIKQLVDLKVLLLGADVVLGSDVMKWLALCPQHQVVNEYGPTETTVSATSYFVNKDGMVNEASVPIGRPAFNTTCYLLDKHGNLCPAGVKGELYIGGAQVTNGYLAKPALTHEKFIIASFNQHQEVIYKTGDLACWLPDGNLQFFGRNDFQVKIQGYRIELTGIESVLLKSPAIHQAVVVVKKGHFKEKYLRAYLVIDNQQPVSSSDIKSYVSLHLPSYMIPKEFCVTHSIPLKENEKIDFEALEKQTCTLLTVDHAIAEELTSFEKTSMRIWQNAFHDNSISSHEDFFEMGGDSLLALQIITELKKYYQIDIPLYYLFEYPTISLLSSKIEELMTSHDGTQLLATKSPSTTVIKLSAGDHGIPLFLVHPVGGSVFWYKQLATYLDGKYTVYGVQDASIDGVGLRFNTLEEMASHYLKEIEPVYSGDNYYLGGASFGATVAFEMAHQLVASNKRIGFLGLFDGWATYPDEMIKESTAHLLTQKENGDHAISAETSDYLSRLEDYRKKLLINYKLSVLDIDAVLFKATELWPSFAQMDDAYNGWHPYISGKITTHKIPGNHETIFFDPNVHALVKHLADLVTSRTQQD